MTIKVRHDAWDPNDPIPWAFAVVEDHVVIHAGWAGTEAEAYEYANAWVGAYIAELDA